MLMLFRRLMLEKTSPLQFPIVLTTEFCEPNDYGDGFDCVIEPNDDTIALYNNLFSLLLRDGNRISPSPNGLSYAYVLSSDTPYLIVDGYEFNELITEFLDSGSDVGEIISTETGGSTKLMIRFDGLVKLNVR